MSQLFLCHDLFCGLKNKSFESALVRWMNLEPVMQSEVRRRKTNVVY